ncbi:MAG: LamG domain-containing protein [Planctomycetes bacterium]|nr:LamG domain-containing protein [Planctomycetota bacterium]MBL7143977.1 LamG domain-containing protein [Phycisphaerae bacterium]
MCKKLIYFVSFVFVLGIAGSALADLVAYWPLDDDANDTIGGLHWTLDPNGTGISTDSLVGTGALRFDGISGEGRQDAVGALVDAFTTKTVIFWVRADSTSGIQALYDEGGSTNGLAVRINEGTLQAAVRDNSDQYTLTIPFDSTEWTEVAVSYDNGLLLLLVDGAEKATVMATFDANEVSSHTNNATIGSTEQDAFGNNTTEPSDHFAGLMDDIRLYDNALPVHITTAPSPADGAVLSSTPVDLFWTPGASAVSQDLYFGENYDDVDAGAESTFLALGQTAAGVDVPITVDDLAAETTYYWRIDAVDEADPWKGQIWSFTLASQTASDPSPTDGAQFVHPATILSWAQGLNAESHTVYIGNNLDDVSNATGGTPQSESNYTPEATLGTGKVYYWRVDEFDGKDTYKGNVWSFETPPFTEISDPNLVGWWKLDGEYLDLGYVFDYSGYNRHGTLGGEPQLIEGHIGNALEFDGVDDYVNIDGYKGINAIDGVQQPFSVANWFRITAESGDHEMVTWGTSAGQQRLTWRVHQGRLRTEHASGNLRGNTYVNDGEWHHGALVVTEGANLRVPNTKLYVDGIEDTTFSGSDNTYNLTAGADVRIGMSGPQNGRYFPGSIDDVRIFDKVLTDNEVKIIAGLLESTSPDPADGAKIVDSLAILTWSPGPFGAEFDVYFGTNPEPGAAELVGRVSAATHIVTDLAEGQTYYWRVDDVEADGTTIHTGNVWNLWVPPKGAYNPNPANGQEVTDIDADLSWEADWSPVLSVVHFGTDAAQVTNAPEGFGPPLMEPGFDPGPLEPGQTYYWRVDVFYGSWLKGEVLSFTVPAP